MKQFLQSSQHAELLAPEIEQFLSLCRQALRSFPQAIASSPGAGQLSLYWSCLQLATALIELDHQVCQSSSICGCVPRCHVLTAMTAITVST